SRGRLVWRRFLRRKAAVGGIVVLVVLFLLAFGGPHLTKWHYLDQDLSNGLQGPTWNHYFGTTQLGQDVFARTMKGLQKSLVIGLLTAFFSTGIGAQPPDVSLGTLIADGTASFLTYPWLFLFAAGLLITAVLSVNVMGDGPRDALDPNSSAVTARTRTK